NKISQEESKDNNHTRNKSNTNILSNTSKKKDYNKDYNKECKELIKLIVGTNKEISEILDPYYYPKQNQKSYKVPSEEVIKDTQEFESSLKSNNIEKILINKNTLTKIKTNI